jgi:hypothetical protein
MGDFEEEQEDGPVDVLCDHYGCQLGCGSVDSGMEDAAIGYAVRCLGAV